MGNLVENINTQNWSISSNEQGEIVSDIEDINQCIYIILTTIPGTDPLNLLFGCGVWEYVDQPANIAVPNMIREIGAAIAEFEPRANVSKIKYELDISQNTLTIFWYSVYGESSTELKITK
jgi:phage baseplate assembly protein W